MDSLGNRADVRPLILEGRQQIRMVFLHQLGFPTTAPRCIEVDGLTETSPLDGSTLWREAGIRAVPYSTVHYRTVPYSTLPYTTLPYTTHPTGDYLTVDA